MADWIHGKNVILSAYDTTDYFPFLCATNCSISVSSEIVPKSTITSGSYRENYARIQEWGLTLEGVSTIDGPNSVFRTIMEAVRRTGLNIEMLFTDDAGAEKALRGHVLIEDTTINGDVNAFSDYSVSFIGNGPLEIDTDPLSTIYGSVKTYDFTAAGGETSFSNALLIGHDDADVLLGFREGYEQEIIFSGTPGNRQLLYTEVSGTISWTGAAVAGEKFSILYQV
jgi:hypothetical protein